MASDFMNNEECRIIWEQKVMSHFLLHPVKLSLYIPGQALRAPGG
jgi:hypothetical protein